MTSTSFLNEVMRCSYISFALSRLMLVVICIIGAFYAVDETIQSGAVADETFILLLVAATVILLVGEHVLRSHMMSKGLSFFENSTISDHAEKLLRYRTLFNRTWSSTPRIIVGIIYGTAVAAAAFVVYQRADQPRLAAWLASFLFGVNFVTGAALTSLFQFVRQTPHLVKVMRIDIWNIDNPTTAYLVEAYNLIAIVGVVYVSASLTSIVYSSLQINVVVFSYGAFAICILGLSMFLPYVPIMIQASEQRSQLLERIAAIVNLQIKRCLEDPDQGYVAERISEFERLIAIRKTVEELKILPRRTRVFGSFLAVLVTSWIPVVATLFQAWRK